MQQNSVICSFEPDSPWLILSSIEQNIKRKIEAAGKPLKEWGVSIYRGILTGCNEAFIINTDKRNEILSSCQDDTERKRTEELIRPIIRGRDIKRYEYKWNDLWLINTHNGLKDKMPRVDINIYPAVKAHLDKFWNKISHRLDKGDTPYNLRNCAYMEDFSKPQIAWIELSDEPKFVYIEDLMSLNTVFFMTGNDIKHILGVLNSRLITWYFKSCLGTSSGVGTNRWLKYTIESLPIARRDDQLINFVDTMLHNPTHKLDNLIDTRVCSLYGLNEEEKLFIAQQVSMP